MSSLTSRILASLWPWKAGPAANIYQLILGPGMSLLSRDNSSEKAISEARLSLTARPDYLQDAVKETYQAMKSLHGRKLPLRVNVVSKNRSSSLTYGLNRADHLIQLRGEKGSIDEFWARLREVIVGDKQAPGLDAPMVIGQRPQNWLTSAFSVPVRSPLSGSGDGGWLRSLGVAGLMLGVVAALAWFSDAQSSKKIDGLQAAVTHLTKRGSGELQLVRKESVEGGEKFYFQGPTENYTVVVDKDGRVYSWSKVPSGAGGLSLK